MVSPNGGTMAASGLFNCHYKAGELITNNINRVLIHKQT
jgi:hypothetical protein